MNLPEFMTMIYDNFNGADIQYVVDMIDVAQDIPNLRTVDHRVMCFFGSDGVLPFLLECDINQWELVEWNVEMFQDEQPVLTCDTLEPVKKIERRININLRRYNV